MGEAIVDDVTIGLMSWQQDASNPSRWMATVRAASAAELPVRFVPELVSLTVIAGGSETALAPLPESTLPCVLNPGDRATITLQFQLETNQTAVHLAIGLQEENRSGAHVVFPLGTGATSATGGDGVAGADATGGDALGADATASGIPANPANPTGQASPAAGSCAD
jgi:hypothetical protein